MSSISAIHTPCKDCVFAIYDGITQNGCHLSYIDKYRNKGAEILEVYDDEKEFYVINDKKCLGYRDNAWIKKNNLAYSSIEEKLTKFQNANFLQYFIMVDLKNFTLDDLNNFGTQLKSCKVLPEKIIFVRYQDDNQKFTYDAIKQFFSSAGLNCKWRIQTMVDGSLSHDSIRHTCCNLNKGYRFMMSIKSYSDDICKIVDFANDTVHEKLDPITVVSNGLENVVLFSAPSYRWSIVVEHKNILDDKSNYILI